MLRNLIPCFFFLEKYSTRLLHHMPKRRQKRLFFQGIINSAGILVKYSSIKINCSEGCGPLNVATNIISEFFPLVAVWNQPNRVFMWWIIMSDASESVISQFLDIFSSFPFGFDGNLTINLLERRSKRARIYIIYFCNWLHMKTHYACVSEHQFQWILNVHLPD